MTAAPPERRRAEAVRAAAGALDVLNIADVDALLRVAAWILGEHQADDDTEAAAWARSMANMPDDKVHALLVRGGWLPTDEHPAVREAEAADRAEQAAAKGGQIAPTPGGDQQDDGPEADRFGTVRVHPGEDPEDPIARRAWLINARGIGPMTWWDDDAVSWRSHAEVQGWPRQSLADVARVLSHLGTAHTDNTRR
ncbi:hypothetical protein SAMN05216215_108733 [Saccharopolyspora shandongensis]|uniref:Uncharacterized protein n=1 Tax=Saccharopolyspora shandongensis TaxID=418495 RepID=A0A1H3TNJ8_9PSEU|nr:hypothetical protein [Saccharopolyspora shandongensis]SDZ51468.1 hypothetical protein SAMN05216215_108733 [Saccharopolyspora shandongensis]